MEGTSHQAKEAPALAVSFVVPSFNQGQYLGECLNSIAGQNLPAGSFDVWVIDGGSSDGTLEVLQNHPLNNIPGPRSQEGEDTRSALQWVSQPDAGHFDAVNKGIARAQGQLICWVNSDDAYAPGAIAKIVDYFKANPSCMWAYGEADFIDAAGEYIKPYRVTDWNYNALAHECTLCQPATIFRKRVWEACGPLSGQYPVALDLEYWLRIGRTFTPQRLGFKVASSRLWGGTKSTLQQLQMQKDALALGRRYTGITSPRRKWAVAEGYTLRTFPFLKNFCRFKKNNPLSYLLWPIFWMIKSMLYAGISVRCVVS